MPNYKITVEYDGTNFVGWQQQANGISIQSSLQDSVYKLSGEKVVVYGAGRTDAGVHAYGQVASFSISKAISTDVIRDGLNQHLRPLMISVLKAEKVENDFKQFKPDYVFHLAAYSRIQVAMENPLSISIPKNAVPKAVEKTIRAVVRAFIDPIYFTP